MIGAALDTRAEQLLRELAPQVLGAVVRRFGDFAGAEDAVQEALVAAALQAGLTAPQPASISSRTKTTPSSCCSCAVIRR